MLDLVYFELNNWFSGRDYPNEEPFTSWIDNYTLWDNNEWCKQNNLVVLAGNVDMSLDYCITATRDWVMQNCPELLSGKTITYTTIIHSKDGVKKVEHEKCMSDFLRYPDEGGDVYGRFGWKFPDYDDCNFGIHYVGG